MKLFMKYVKLLTVCLLLFLLSGCWDYKEVTYLNYATSLGIDYIDNEYTVYIQVLNFASLAKQEGQALEKKPIVVGKAKGKTISDAVFELYRSEQFPVFWGHITSIVFTKEAIQNINFQVLIDVLNRYREIRYNVWAYVTERSIEELYNLTPFFGLSPYESILMNPMDTYGQYSDIKPLYLFQFLAHYLEPGKTAMIPILSYDSKTWEEGKKKSEQLMLDGAYFFHEEKFKGKLKYGELIGKRYLEKNMERTLITINENNDPILNLIIKIKDYKVKHTVKSGKVFYDLELKARATIEEMRKELSEDAMLSKMKEILEEQIRSTFEKGLQISADVLNLNETVYRHDYKTWKKYIQGKPVEEITELRNIHINGVILHSGKYKDRIEGY